MTDAQLEIIKASAEAEAKENLKHGNYINTKIIDGETRVIVSTFIDDKLAAWITYDADQLDILIELLQRAQKTISS
jgi:hypothetical protein